MIGGMISLDSGWARVGAGLESTSSNLWLITITYMVQCHNLCLSCILNLSSV